MVIFGEDRKRVIIVVHLAAVVVSVWILESIEMIIYIVLRL